MHSAVPIGLSESTNPIGTAENKIKPVGLIFLPKRSTRVHRV